MNYRLFIILMMMTIIAGCAKPKIIVQDHDPRQIIHCSQIQNVEKISNYVFYLSEGDIIPLKMTLDSELLDIAHEEIHLVLKQKVYFRIKIPEGLTAENISAMSKENKQELYKNTMIYLSSDAKRWAAYTDIKAVEKLFRIKGGSFSFGMGITKEEGLEIFLNAATNRFNGK